MKYEEGIFVGYRWYEKQNIQPLYPFGHGLSYTQFEYSNLEIKSNNFANEIVAEITFDVKNIGEVSGAETAQIYISDLECSVDRPEKELKSFDKVYLQPEESQIVSIKLTKDAFAFYYESSGQWETERGEFKISVGSSSADIRLEETIFLR